MKIVVIGDGKIGFTLTQALVAEGHDLVVIDNQKEPLDKTETALDVQIREIYERWEAAGKTGIIPG